MKEFHVAFLGLGNVGLKVKPENSWPLNATEMLATIA
jgi:hypothetical protein